MFPEAPRTLEEQQAREDTWPSQYFRIRWVMEDSGTPLGTFGYLEPFWQHHPGRYDIYLHLDVREMASATMAAVKHCLDDMKPREATEATTWMRSDAPEVLSALSELGFEEVERAPTTGLQVNAFDASPYEKKEQRLVSEGVRLVSLAELEAEGADFQRDLWDAMCEMDRDIPSENEITPPSFEEHLELLGDRVNHDYTMMFVALDQGQIVGYTHLQPKRANPQVAQTGLSGTRRSHRRRGIVTALKVKSIEAARERGVELILTDNLSNNPMYDINLRLGYVRLFDWVCLRKQL